MACQCEQENYLQQAILIAKAAGVGVKAAFNIPNKKVDYKRNKNDLVTETDKQTEALIFSKLRALFPTHKFIGEETSSANDMNLTSDPTWIVDPIDGTTNFVYRIPYCAVSIALYEERKPVVAVLYNPMAELLYTASAGQGAFLNGQPIQVSGVDALETAMVISIALLSGVHGSIPWQDQVPCAFFDTINVRDVRTFGSAALELCEVAKGSGDVFLLNGLFCWDVAASVLILREAGGFVCDMDENGLEDPDDYDIFSRQCIAGASKSIIRELLARFREFKARNKSPIY